MEVELSLHGGPHNIFYEHYFMKIDIQFNEGPVSDFFLLGRFMRS